MALPLASLEKLLTFLEAEPDSRNAHRYRAALLTASRQIEDFCGRDFSRKAHSEFVTPFRDPGRRIPLKGFPVVSTEPSSVKLNGSALASTDYRFEDGSLILKIRSEAERGSVEVEYVSGYPTVVPTREADGIQIPDPENAYTSAPEDLATACVYQALTIERMTAQPNIGVDRITADAGVSAAKFNMIHGFEPTAYSLIVAYRRPPFFGRS